jgi:hypothetical protein
MQPLAALPYARARQVWMLVTTLALLTALAVAVRLVRALAALTGMQDSDIPWIVLAAFFASALNSTSVHNDIRAGSVGAILFLCATVVALHSVVRQRAATSATTAAAVTAATLVKLVPGVWIGWLAWRGARRAAWGAAILLALTMVPALAHWGADIVPAYIRDALLPSLRDDVAPPMNQSLDAALSRLFVTSSWTTPPLEAPLVARILSWLATAAVATMTLYDLARARRASVSFVRPIEFGHLVLAMLLVMKLTWVQTLCAMLFVWPALMIVLAAAAAAGLPWARRTTVVACIGYFLSSAHVPILWTGLRHGPAVVLTDVHTVGMLLLWGACGVVLRRAAALQGCAATTARG